MRIFATALASVLLMVWTPLSQARDVSCPVRAAACGKVQATYEGVNAYCNGAEQSSIKDCDTTGTYGDRYQCVEFVRRFYAQKFGIDTTTYCWKGDAITYSDTAGNYRLRGLTVFKNGQSAEAPRAGDILVFKGVVDTVGHVGIVRDGATSTEVPFIEQNFSQYSTIPLKLLNSGGKFTLTRAPEDESKYQVVAWSRPSMGPIILPKSYSIGTQVQMKESGVSVRDKAAGDNVLSVSHQAGDDGKIMSGPAYACSNWWWNVDFDSGKDGWVAEPYLTSVNEPTTSTTPKSVPATIAQPRCDRTPAVEAWGGDESNKQYNTLLRCGNVAAQLGQFETAISHWNSAIPIDPGRDPRCRGEFLRTEVRAAKDAIAMIQQGKLERNKAPEWFNNHSTQLWLPNRCNSD